MSQEPGSTKINEEGSKKEEISPFIQALSKLKMKNLSHLQFVLFGLSMMLGNRNFTWNTGLQEGYDTLIVDILYAGTGYICICLCMGEMSSALPFSGGIFGYVRAALGPFNGFLVASCEFVYCTTFVVMKVNTLIEGIRSSQSTDTDVSYGLVLVVYGLCLGLSLIGGKPVFALTSLIGFFTFSVLCIYLFGTLGSVGTGTVSYARYAGPTVPITWGSLMGARVAAGTQFSGIQYFPLLSHYLKDPRSQVPRMMIISCVIFILFSVFITLAAVSQAPGAETLASADLPLKYGFARLFNVNIDVAKWIDIPCLFGVVFGFFYCSGKQLFAITQSGLLPPILNATIPGVETPYLCYTLAACVGAVLNMYVVAYPENLIQIQSVSIISTLYICVLCLIAYMVFRRKFSSMTHAFVNPFGDGAAIYGIIYYLTSAIALFFYTAIRPYYLVAFAIYLILATIFFWTYLVKHQKFSEEEKKMMFKAYLINANLQKQKHLHHHHHHHPSGHLKNNKVAPSTSHDHTDASHRSHPMGALSVSLSTSNSAVMFTTIPHRNQLEPVNEDGIPKSERKEEVRKSDETMFNSPTKSQAEVISSERHSEVASTKLSQKIVSFVSEKIQTVLPAMNNMNAEELQDYEQLAALASGGMMEESERKALEVRIGMDVESGELNS